MDADGWTTRDGSHLRVLLVDDSRDLREILTTLLRREGADVAKAATGHEALEWMRRHTFDMVVTDFNLPDIAGDELIGRLVVGAPRRPDIVVVTDCDVPRLRRARVAGADQVFRKPVEWEDLAAYVRRVKTARSAWERGGPSIQDQRA